MARVINNLPIQLTSFVGRSRELEELGDRVAQYRLVTLVGAGGTGKTRLALQLGGQKVDQFRDGVWLVELAPVREPSLARATIAAVLGVPDRPELPTRQSLSAHLQSKQILLVLDNCEHLAGAIASLVVSILADCPELRIIATSREALGVQGEALWWTPSLNPSESVQLFVERSLLKVPTFSLTEDNADAIGTICRRLDGIPLALELAAGLTGAMTSDDIAAGLDDRLGLLVSNVRGGPARHETLEKALDWSYNLLTPEEMVVFRRLAVFAGGFSLEAAQLVCGDRSLAPELVRAILSQLVHKSMLVTDSPSEGRSRYRLLETLREYAEQKLRNAGEELATRRRHLDYFVALVEDAYDARMLSGAEGVMTKLRVELDNIRAVLRYATENDPEGGLRLAGASWELWFANSQTEGRRWLATFLDVASQRTRYRARALRSAGMLAMGQQAYEQGLSVLTESYRLSTELEDQPGRAWAALALGQLELVVPLNPQRARGWVEEALTLHRAANNQFGIGRAIGSLGLCELDAGNVREGVSCLKQCLEIVTHVGDVWGEAFALTFLGWAMMREEPDEAVAHLRAAVRALRQGPDPMLLATALEGYAGLVMGSDLRTAIRLIGAGAALRDQVGNQRARPAVELAAAVMSQGLKALGTKGVQEESRHGSQLSAIEASEMVLSEMPRTGQPRPGGLSKRELEIAGLVADGLTSREIAARLYLSERTVENHVDHVLSKLGLRNRTQIATWAVKELSTRH